MHRDASLKQLFEQCVDANADSLYRVAYRLLGDRELATELVQETCLQAWRNLPTLREQSKLRGWMFSILRNQYTRLLRSELRSRTASLTIDPPAGDSSDDVDLKSELVQQAIAQLDDAHKLPLLLVTMESFSIDEAASVLDLPRGTVLSRLHRGRQKLKFILEREMAKLES